MIQNLIFAVALAHYILFTISGDEILLSYPTAMTSLEFLSVTKLLTIAFIPGSTTYSKTGRFI